MKGKLVVIYSMSQMGKDYIAKELMEHIRILPYYDEYLQNALGIHYTPDEIDELYDTLNWHKEKLPGLIKVRYADVYKVRKKRKDDLPYIHTVDNENDIPSDFSLRQKTSFGQVLAYNPQMIEQQINNGEIVFLVTTNLELTKLLKTQFKKDCEVVKIIGRAKSKKQIMEYENKRYPNDKEMAESQGQLRYEAYQKEFEEYAEFSDFDYSIKNMLMIYNDSSIAWGQQVKETEDAARGILIDYRDNVLASKKEKAD